MTTLPLTLPLLLPFLLLAACASGTQRPSVPPATGPTPLAEVPPQRLARGQCALALWARLPVPTRILVALNNPAVARVNVGGRIVDLPQTATDGEPVFGHFPTSSYAGEGFSLKVNVDFSPDGRLSDGALIHSGAIEAVTPSGEAIVLAVGGMVGCQR